MSRLTQWALRLSEFDYTVLHKSGKKHLNADALSQHVNVIAIPLISKHKIPREQLLDKFCQQQKQNFGSEYKVTKDGVLYNTNSEQPRVVIPRALVTQVISQHHDTIFSGHQGIKRTVGIIGER